jgi:hypothetical protein
VRPLVAVSILAFACASCGGAADVNLPEQGFRQVQSEKVGLNGQENQGRPPLDYQLLAGTEGVESEPELVERYAQLLTADGWNVRPVDESDPSWWTARAFKAGPTESSEASVIVGPAGGFVERPSPESGMAGIKFRRAYGAGTEPMIVISLNTDP